MISAQLGPVYPLMGPTVQKFRRILKTELTAEQRAAYAAAIEQKIKALQRSELMRELPSFKPNCASGTWHNNADGKIGESIRASQRAALLACPARYRRERTPGEWQRMYDDAMRAKRGEIE